MPILKPQRGIQLNKNYWASRELVACWLMNEGSGKFVFDSSGNGYNGTFVDDVHFVQGKFGWAADFDDEGDERIDIGEAIIPENDFTLLFWVNFDEPYGEYVISQYESGKAGRLSFGIVNGNAYMRFGNAEDYGSSVSIDVWHQFVATKRGDNINVYIDGVLDPNFSIVSSDDTCQTLSTKLGYTAGVPGDMFIDHGMIYNRALTASEITYLYRNPFCMFDKGPQAGRICSPMVYVSLTGSASAQSSAQGWLTVSCGEPEPERFWLRDALLNGMTAESFKLGTVLSLGWFWNRVNGCTALYRGCSAEQIDFDNILAVTGPDAELINPPSYVPHEPDSIYFYVIRRFNSIGYQERTLAASAKIAIDSNGNLKEPLPNKIYASWTTCTEGNKVRIVWYYCPLEQKSPPVCFKIYFDDGSGKIDFENPLTEIEYRGRMFYSYKSPQLQSSRYLFAVRAENADGFENDSQARIQIQLCSQNPNPIEIIEVRSCY